MIDMLSKFIGDSRMKITYKKDITGLIDVYLDGEKIGYIDRMYISPQTTDYPKKGYAYKAIGGEWGDAYPTLTECKRSIEGNV